MFNRCLRSTYSLRLRSSLLAGLLCLVDMADVRAEAACCVHDPGCLTLVHQAKVFSEKQQFEDALRLYEQAYARVADPGLLPNIGRMQQRLGRDEQALATYRLFLSQPPLPDDEELRRKVPEWIVETQPHNKSLGSPAPMALQPVPTLTRQAEKDSDSAPRHVLNKSAQSVRSPWIWMGISAALATAAAVAIGLRVGLTGCRAGEICFTY